MLIWENQRQEEDNIFCNLSDATVQGMHDHGENIAGYSICVIQKVLPVCCCTEYANREGTPWASPTLSRQRHPDTEYRLEVTSQSSRSLRTVTHHCEYSRRSGLLPRGSDMRNSLDD
jgi:hypothetical protein